MNFTDPSGLQPCLDAWCGFGGWGGGYFGGNGWGGDPRPGRKIIDEAGTDVLQTRHITDRHAFSMTEGRRGWEYVTYGTNGDGWLSWTVGDQERDAKRKKTDIRKWHAEELQKCLKGAESYRKAMTHLINDALASEMVFGGLASSTISALVSTLIKKAALGGWLYGMGLAYAGSISRAVAGEIGANRGYNMIVENCKRLWQD